MRMVFLILLAVLLAVTPAASATYYVANDGNDSLAGTSEGTAWQTISKVNGSSFVADDQILFKKDGEWREQLLVPSSGTSGHPIVVGSYGSGNKPRILGSTDLQSYSWSNATIDNGTLDLLSETYEGSETPGGSCSGTYDNAGWSCTVGAGSSFTGGNADVARPDGSTKLAKMSKVSPNFNARSIYDMGSAQSVSYFEGYVRVAAEGLGDGNKMILFGMPSTAWWYPWRVYLYQDGSQLQLRLWGETGVGGGWNDPYDISLDTWYRVEVYYSYDDTVIQWKIDGVDQGTFTDLGTGDPNWKPSYVQVGDSANDYTATVYFDRIRVSSTAWPTSPYSVPANAWYTPLVDDPLMVWFEDSNGTVHWGNKETSLADVNAFYDFYSDGVYIFTYSPTTNPSSRWAHIEASTRDHCATAESKDYVTLSNLECAYTESWGMANNSATTGTPGSGWVITGNTVHHVGNKNDSGYADCIVIATYTSPVSGCYVTSNTIYECGNHGIYAKTGNGATLSGTSIEGNTVYNCYHTGIDVMATNGDIADTSISRNLVYLTDEYDSSIGTNLIFVSSAHVSYSVIDTYVDYNVLRNVIVGGIAVGNESYQYRVDGIHIRNNTIYGHLASGTDTNYGIVFSRYAVDNANSVNVQNNIVAMELYDSGSYLLASWADTTYDALQSNVLYSLGGVGTTWINIVGGSSYGSGDLATWLSDNTPKANGTLFSDPKVVSSTNQHLLASSPCIDTGYNLGLTSDFDGVVVMNPPDIGAYQFTAPPPGVVSPGISGGCSRCF